MSLKIFVQKNFCIKFLYRFVVYSRFSGHLLRCMWVEIVLEVLFSATRMQQDSAGFSRIQQDSAGISGIQQDSAGFSRIQQDYAGFSRIQQDSVWFSRIQQHSAEISRNQQDSAGFSRIQQDSVGLSRIQYDSAGYSSPWQFMKTQNDGLRVKSGNRIRSEMGSKNEFLKSN